MKEKTLIYIVVVLVIVNVVALGTIVYQRFGGPLPFQRMPRMNEMRPRMMRELRLSDDQREKLRESRHRLDSLLSPLMGKVKEKRHQIFTEMQKESPDTAAIYRLLDEVGTLQVSIEKTMTGNLLNNSRSLSLEQRAIMMKMIEDRGGWRGGRQMPAGDGPGPDVDDKP